MIYCCIANYVMFIKRNQVAEGDIGILTDGRIMEICNHVFGIQIT